MGNASTRLASVTVAAALLLGSATGAAAEPAPVQAQSSQASWMTLSMLTPSGAIGLAGAAAQPLPPPGSPPPPAYGAATTPPLPVIAIWLATVAMAVYILTKDHHGHFQFPHPQPGSPD